MNTTSPDTAQELPVNPEVTPETPKIYRSIAMNYGLGKYRFVKHQLKATSPEEVEEIEALLEGLSPPDRSQIVTIDVQAANKLALLHQRSAAHRGGMHSGVKPISTDTINHQNSEELLRAGMTPEQVKSAEISLGSDADSNFMQVENVDTASMTEDPAPAPAPESAPAGPSTTPAPAAGSLASLIKPAT